MSRDGCARMDIPVNTRFVLYSWQRECCIVRFSRVDEIRSNAKGTTYPEISKGRFRDMDIIVPPDILVKEFSDTANHIFKQVRILKQSTSKLEQARDLLLPRLMSGEITV